MLDRLDEVDWGSLHHAYGVAKDVPDLLRALASPSKKKRHAAWDTLHGNVWHQGTVWQVTPHVVPFLLELLAEESVAEKDHLLSYLALLAGNSNVRVEAVADDDSEDSESAGVDDDEYCPTDRELQKAGLATRAAVAAGFDRFLPFLESADDHERMSVCHLLGQLPERAEDVVRALRAVVEHDRVARVVACACYSLGAVAPRDLSVQALLRKAAESPESSLPRLAAALTLVCHVERGPLPVSVVRVLVDALADPTPLQAGYAELPFRSMRLDLDVCNVVKQLDRGLAAHVVPALHAMLEREKSPFAATVPVGALLHFAFGDPDWENFQPRLQKRRPAEQLTADQRELLERLLATDMWTFPGGSGNGNLGALLNPLELPTSREEMQTYLGR